MTHDSSYLCVEYKTRQSKQAYWDWLKTLNICSSYCIWDDEHILRYVAAAHSKLYNKSTRNEEESTP